MNEVKILWLVLDVKLDQTVEIVGVFDEEKKALAECIQPNYCLGPLELNRAVHEAQQGWPGAYYPAASTT